MTSRVSSNNKEKRPKGKIVFKKETKQKKKTVPGNRKQRRPGLAEGRPSS